MMVAAYCRVSTDKTDQLNSLETQKAFFEQYCERNGLTLWRIYADEGISGTKTRNRLQFLSMMQEAGNGQFSQVIVKDVSRLARNTVDFLTSIRKLKELNIETVFITSDMRSLGNSEFVLTLMGAMAQEESQNTSKRVKFGKQENAKKGRVPNLVYGYDKISGDYFNLAINDMEAQVVKQIFAWYIEDGHGASRIALLLNKEGLKTKRGCLWSQNAVSRILKNEIYIGRIVNGKEEVCDFLTGHRKTLDKSQHMVTIRQDLAIIDESTFKKACDLLADRHEEFNIMHKRHSNAYIFSTLIKCDCCGCSFRRITRQYKNTYNAWVCSGRNSKGTGSCNNMVKIPEEWLRLQIIAYLQKIIREDRYFGTKVIDYYMKQRITADISCAEVQQLERKEKSLTNKLERLKNLYLSGLIELSELKNKSEEIRQELSQVTKNIANTGHKGMSNEEKRTQLLRLINKEGIIRQEDMTNILIKEIIKKIIVKANGTLEIVVNSKL